MENKEDMEHVDCIARTFFPVLKYSFKWILEGSSRFEEETSPKFHPESVKIHWWLEMERSRNYIHYVRLYRSDGWRNTYVECHFVATDGKGEILQDCTCSSNSENTTKYMTVSNGIPTNEGVVEELSNDILELTIRLKIYETDVREYSTSTQFSFPTKFHFVSDVLQSVSDDLEKFYESQQNTDVVLSIEGETVRVHKAILSARSPVFAKMFQHEMTETTENVIVIEDVTFAAMKEVVDFIYCKVKRDYDYDTAVDVYYAADKYDVKKLKEVCGAILASQINEKNVGDVLNLADRHHDDILKKKVMKFIIFNMKICVKTEWWCNLMSNGSELASDMAAYIADFI